METLALLRTVDEVNHFRVMQRPGFVVTEVASVEATPRRLKARMSQYSYEGPLRIRISCPEFM